MFIQKANIKDHESLTEVTKRSKAYWGYSNEQMILWSDLLTITPEYIQTNQVYKLLIDNTTIGYYSYFNENKNTVRLDNLFIIPDYIGKGIGKILMDHFLDLMKKSGVQKLTVHSDPNTETFYSKFGFNTTGMKETMVKDRFLPVMELEL